MEINQEYTPDEIRENRRIWIEALESGDYTQCREKLTDGTGYCCLGVAGVALGFEVSTEYDGDDVSYEIDGNSGYLGCQVQRMLGFQTRIPSPIGGPTRNDWDSEPMSFVSINDQLRWSFDQIADLLREQPDDWNGFAR